MMMFMEAMHPGEAKKLAIQCLSSGVVAFTGHAYEEMANDGLTEPDVKSTIRGGVVQPPEFKNGSWRYQVRTQKMVAVVAFRSETHMVVVTAWRL